MKASHGLGNEEGDLELVVMFTGVHYRENRSVSKYPKTRPDIKGLLQLHGHRTWVSGASPYVTESCTKQGPDNHPNAWKDRGDVKIAFSKFFQSPLCEPRSHWA